MSEKVKNSTITLLVIRNLIIHKDTLTAAMRSIKMWMSRHHHTTLKGHQATGNPLFYLKEKRVSNEQYDRQISIEVIRVNFKRVDDRGVPPYI